MPNWLKTAFKILLLLLVLAATAAIIFGIDEINKQAEKIMGEFAKTPQSPTVVTTEVVTQATGQQIWKPTLTAVGTLKSVHGIGVTSETAGIITEILFESNQSVAKGDVLVRLDAAVQNASINSIRTQLKLANTELKRQRALSRRGVSARSELDRATAAVDQLNSQIEAQEAIREQKTIRAPFAGRMGIRHVSLGQYITPGTPIATLGTFDPIYVDFSLPEKDIPELKTGLPLTAVVDAMPNSPVNGEISSIELLTNVQTHTIGVRGTLPNPDRKLRPGMFAQVTVTLPQEREVLVIPQTAVSFDPYGKSIWVVTTQTEKEYPVAGSAPGDPTAKMAKAWNVEKRFVQTGATRGDYIEITKNLKAGEQVITTGQFKLRNGSVVSFNNDAAPKASAAPDMKTQQQ